MVCLIHQVNITTACRSYAPPCDSVFQLFEKADHHEIQNCSDSSSHSKSTPKDCTSAVFLGNDGTKSVALNILLIAPGAGGLRFCNIEIPHLPTNTTCDTIHVPPLPKTDTNNDQLRKGFARTVVWFFSRKL